MKTLICVLPGILLIASSCSPQNEDIGLSARSNSAASQQRPVGQAQIKSEPRDYDIVINTQLHPDRSMSIDITSNLPSGSVLGLTVERDFHQRNSQDVYGGIIFEQQVPLSDGKIHVDVPINDAKWYNDHESKVRRLPGVIFPAIHISPNVAVTVDWRPLGQPPEAERILGPLGENLRGKLEHHKNMGKMYHWLETTKTVAIPFDRGLARNEMWVTAKTFQGEWPFTVPGGALGCNPESQAVTFRVGEKIYALNGIAMEERRYLPLEAIWLKNREIPGTRINIGPMIDTGLRFCQFLRM
jgi:hypothetical protein